jgi:TRAP-type C4-dicarboxylate transport system permease large subunit
MVLVIIAGATVFGHFMAISTIPFALADWIKNLAISPMALMGVIIFIYFIGGFFYGFNGPDSSDHPDLFSRGHANGL